MDRFGISIEPCLGAGPNNPKEARALKIVTSWYDAQIEYEADPQQA